MKKIVISSILVILILLSAFVNTYAEEITVGNTKKIDEISYQMGDVNTDGDISAKDALSVLKYAAKIDKHYAVFSVLGDVNSDEKINAQDAMNILKYAAKMMQDSEISVNRDLVVLDKVGAMFDLKDFTRLVTSMDQFNDFIEYMGANGYKNYREKIKKYYSEEFFQNKNLIVSFFVDGGSGCYEQIFEGLFYKNGEYVVRVRTISPYMQSPDTGSWCLFIPVGKEVSAQNSFTTYKYYDSEFLPFTNPVKYEAKKADGDWSVRVISNYSDYREYVNAAIATVKGEVDIDICDEEFFENNILIIAKFYVPDRSVDVSVKNIRKIDGRYYLNIKRAWPSVCVEDVAYWQIMIPVEGKLWENTEFGLMFEDVSK